MTTQLLLPTGESLRNQGTAKVLANNRIFQGHFSNEAKWMLLVNGEVTSEDVTDRLMVKPTHQNAIGACMRSFAKANGLAVVGYRKSTRPSRHAGLISVWAKPRNRTEGEIAQILQGKQP